MKVKLIKDFGEHKAGDTVEVTEERAEYWQRVGLIAGGTKETEPAAEKRKVTAPKKEKNEKAGPVKKK
jgi:hypothetical protein